MLSKRHLVLSQIHDPRYELFYIRRRQEGDILILDNGAYEGKQSTESELIGAIESYRPQITVLPDVFLDSWEKTYQRAYDFLDKYYQRFPKMQWMYVPQGPKGDVMNWVDGLIHACDELPISYVGLPRCLATDVSLDPLIRANACKLIRSRWPHLKVHALGMVKGNTSELRFLDQAGCESVDSSAPVWRGWNGYSLLSERDMVNWNEHGTDCRFDDIPPISITKAGRDQGVRGAWELIIGNLQACGVNTDELTSRTGQSTATQRA